MNVIQGEGWVEYREGEGLIHYMNKDRIQEEYMEKVWWDKKEKVEWSTGRKMDGKKKVG